MVLFSSSPSFSVSDSPVWKLVSVIRAVDNVDVVILFCDVAAFFLRAFGLDCRIFVVEEVDEEGRATIRGVDSGDIGFLNLKKSSNYNSSQI